MFDAAPNRLLASLPETTRLRVLSACHPVDLPLGTVLFEANRRPSQAFFLLAGFAAQIVTVGEISSAGLGLLGPEGVIGEWALLGPAVAPGACSMRAAGNGYALPFGDLQTLFHDSEELRAPILEFVQVQVLAASHLAACNHLHEDEARLSRWLLMLQDRLQADTFSLTPDLIAHLLGVQERMVSSSTGALQRSGFIEYKHGHVRIIDRSGLEDTACECYGYLRSLYQGLYRVPLA